MGSWRLHEVDNFSFHVEMWIMPCVLRRYLFGYDSMYISVYYMSFIIYHVFLFGVILKDGYFMGCQPGNLYFLLDLKVLTVSTIGISLDCIAFSFLFIYFSTSRVWERENNWIINILVITWIELFSNLTFVTVILFWRGMEEGGV